MANYKPLKIKGKTPENLAKNEDNEDDFEVELLDSDDDFDPNLGLEDDEEEQDSNETEEQEEDNEDEDSEETSEEDDRVGNSEDDSDDEEAEEEEEKPRGPRENDRIRSLIEERNREREAVKRERQERLKLQKQMVEMQKNTVKVTSSTLKDNITGIKKQMVQAKQADDEETYIDLQERLNKAQIDLLALESWTPPEVEEIEEESVDDKKPKSIDEAPKAVRDWADKNSWFKNPATVEDRKRQREAIAYSEVLASEGYSIDSEEFFEMIDERLQKLGLAKPQKNKVESKNTNSNSSDGRKKKKISQTVQGASRTPASSTKSKTKVVLTPEQQKIADLYGISYKEYAEELLLIEQSEKAGKRMTTLKR